MVCTDLLKFLDDIGKTISHLRNKNITRKQQINREEQFHSKQNKTHQQQQNYGEIFGVFGVEFDLMPFVPVNIKTNEKKKKKSVKRMKAKRPREQTSEVPSAHLQIAWKFREHEEEQRPDRPAPTHNGGMSNNNTTIITN